MVMRVRRAAMGYVLCAGLAVCATVVGAGTGAAQAPAAATPPQRGTVKSIAGNVLTVTTDAGPTVTITVPDGAKVQQLAVGSTDLKTATPSQLSEIAVGDRVLSSVKAGDTPDVFTAKMVVLMKSGDIAQKNAAEQADWRRNGTGGIVSALDAASGTITLTAGTKKVTVSTSGKTEFRRFAGDSVQFQDSKPGTLAQVQVGDQVQARGVKSEDGSSVQAVEVVSGSFKNLSGLITALDPAAGTLTLKDLATKKVVTVTVTKNSDVRKMPLQMATMFAARTSGGGAGAGSARGAGGGAPQGAPAGAPGADAGGGGMRRGGGGDLSQMIGRLPSGSLADLKTGDAVMVVASEASPGATNVTAVTLLSGVEPILTANPKGGMDLSGWSMGGGGGGGPE